MSEATVFFNRDGYLLAKITLPWTAQNAIQAFDEIKEEVSKQHYKFLLIDFTKWEKPDEEFTRYKTGVYFANIFHAPLKVAGYTKVSAINKFGENTAVNRGAQFRIFGDEQNAIQWLLKGTDLDSSIADADNDHQ